MSRRTSLPGASELFRSTGDGAAREAQPDAATAATSRAAQQLAEAPTGEPAQAQPRRTDGSGSGLVGERSLAPTTSSLAQATRRRVDADAERRPTGRERHDEKITVYISPEELMDLERARLTLRGEHGLAVDRGRIVREALALVLADLEVQGEQCALVRRLHGA